MNKKLPQITHVAIQYTLNGSTVTIAAPRPNRHHNLLNKHSVTVRKLKSAGYRECQGFLWDHSTFVNRSAAHSIALLNGQMKQRDFNGPDELYSEDIW